jgi:hypothetical protein
VAGRKAAPVSKWQSKTAGSGIQPDGSFVPEFSGQRPPLRPGHEVTVRSGFYISPLLREQDAAEVEEIGAELRELLPVYRDSFEPLLEIVACRVWRLRRGYRDLSENGLLRKGGQPAPILVDLAKLEGGLVRDLAELGLTPRAMVGLGLDLLRGQQAQLTARRLARMVEEEEAGGEAA